MIKSVEEMQILNLQNKDILQKLIFIINTVKKKKKTQYCNYAKRRFKKKYQFCISILQKNINFVNKIVSF